MVIFCSLPVPRSLAADVHDAVGVDVEGDLNLRHAPRRGGDAGQLEPAQGLVIGRHFPLALEHVYVHRRLAVRRRGEHLALLALGMVVLRSMSRVNTPPMVSMPRDRGVTSSSTHVLHLAAQHARLDGRADGHALVRVDALVGLLADDPLHGFLHCGDTGGTAHQDHLIHLGSGEARRPAGPGSAG